MRQAVAAALCALAIAPANVVAASIGPGAQVVQREPSAGAHLRTFFPIFSATIRNADRNTVHLFVDGRDVTSSASLNGAQVQYVPRERMSPGWHDVFLEGVGRDRRRFSDSWVFQTESPDGFWTTSPPIGNFQFLPSGGFSFFPGQFMHFFLIAPTDGFAVLQLCGLGQFPFSHQPFSPVFFVTVAVPVTPISPFVNCQIGAFFTPLNGFDTVLVPLPVGISIFSKDHRGTVPVFRSPNVPISGVRSTMPVYRNAPQQNPGAPVSSGPVGYPITVQRPIVVTRPITVQRPIAMPHAGMPHAIVVPHPAVPVMHP